MSTNIKHDMHCYLEVRVEVAIESFTLVSALACECTNLQVLLPRVAESKASVSRFPSCEIRLQIHITIVLVINKWKKNRKKQSRLDSSYQ